ncbi:hypothetical protein BSKO_00003 [Bryopsis sp. KO-2023]|nr:hypothetical protein BSKO_00003 [Bryopsis sp. KO-2023]
MKGKTRCCIKGHTLQGAFIDHITLSPLGYNEAQIQSLPQVEGLVKDVRLGELTDSTEDFKVAEVIVKVERESAGHVPVCVRHFVEGFTS